MHTDFFWLAVHCLEKYLKAALLLNERSAKGYSHDIVRLYAEARLLAPELLPATLRRPENVPPDLFSRDSEATETFVERLNFYGQPDNRYQFIGYVRRGEDIIKLDQVVYAIRGLCQPLESHFLGNRFKDKKDVPQLTRREVLGEGDTSIRNLGSNLEKVIAGGRGKLLRRVLLNWNFPFAPPDFKHGQMSYGHMSVNPVFVRRFLEPLDAGTPKGDRHADKLWEWGKENIHLPREFMRLYEEERERRKAAARARRTPARQQP